jgi:secreted PhoX family phosphatase
MPGDGSTALTDPARFASYTVIDDLTVPKEYRYSVVARWADRFGPDEDPASRIRFGFNCDYTALIPIRGEADEFWLVVNHEYISARIWLAGQEEADPAFPRLRHVNSLTGRPLRINGRRVPARTRGAAGQLTGPNNDISLIGRAALDDLGVTVLHVKRSPDGNVSVVGDSPLHARCSGARTVRIKPGPNGSFDGPAAGFMGDVPPRTFANCSGGTTPWSTALTCEENFQDQIPEAIAPDGRPLPWTSGGSAEKTMPFTSILPDPATQLPFKFAGLASFADPALDGRMFGWVAEIDPATGTFVKHTALGRMRHENVALRVTAEHPVAAYMGDDRRGGHVWKFVSRDVVGDPADSGNTRLFRDGTLYAARFREDFSGEWIPLRPETKLRRPEPGHCVKGTTWLPRRPRGGLVTVRGNDNGRTAGIPLEQWVGDLERYAGKRFAEMTLGDLVGVGDYDKRLGILLMDAFAMANCIGGTPTARPEDIEIHPHDHSVYVAFTDNSGSGSGSPDMRVFPDSKRKNSRQYGAIYRLQEDGDDPAARTFTWGRFVSAGETSEQGGGFAHADNMVFDPQGNLWMVTDISTNVQNAAVQRSNAGTRPGDQAFSGIFGNNALFCIPTRGPGAGVPHCFAIGPMESELTGPTFTPDGKTLMLSVQHPGEWLGARGRKDPDHEVRTVEITGRDGRTIAQKRTVPRGSNFPSGRLGDLPRPSVVCITRGEV